MERQPYESDRSTNSSQPVGIGLTPEGKILQPTPSFKQAAINIGEESPPVWRKQVTKVGTGYMLVSASTSAFVNAPGQVVPKLRVVGPSGGEAQTGFFYNIANNHVTLPTLSVAVKGEPGVYELIMEVNPNSPIVVTGDANDVCNFTIIDFPF